MPSSAHLAQATGGVGAGRQWTPRIGAGRSHSPRMAYDPAPCAGRMRTLQGAGVRDPRALREGRRVSAGQSGPRSQRAIPRPPGRRGPARARTGLHSQSCAATCRQNCGDRRRSRARPDAVHSCSLHREVRSRPMPAAARARPAGPPPLTRLLGDVPSCPAVGTVTPLLPGARRPRRSAPASRSRRAVTAFWTSSMRALASPAGRCGFAGCSGRRRRGRSASREGRSPIPRAGCDRLRSS